MYFCSGGCVSQKGSIMQQEGSIAEQIGLIVANSTINANAMNELQTLHSKTI